MTTETKKPRNKWPPELAWPSAPEGERAFLLLVLPDFPKDTPKEERRPWRRVRLSDLTTDELTWVAMTLAVEVRRRKVRPAIQGPAT